MNQLRRKVQTTWATWQTGGLPSHNGYKAFASEIKAWKEAHGIPGLWSEQPLMLSATVDDAWGHGVQVINQIAEALGCQVKFLGVCLTAPEIIAACQADQPDLLGLTVLQLDSDDILTEIQRSLPTKTVTVAGGPVFKCDDDFAPRTGIQYTANHGADFVRFLLDFNPTPAPMDRHD